jgi:hypothetical protein
MRTPRKASSTAIPLAAIENTLCGTMSIKERMAMFEKKASPGGGDAPKATHSPGAGNPRPSGAPRLPTNPALSPASLERRLAPVEKSAEKGEKEEGEEGGKAHIEARGRVASLQASLAGKIGLPGMGGGGAVGGLRRATVASPESGGESSYVPRGPVALPGLALPRPPAPPTPAEPAAEGGEAAESGEALGEAAAAPEAAPTDDHAAVLARPSPPRRRARAAKKEEGEDGGEGEVELEAKEGALGLHIVVNAAGEAVVEAVHPEREGESAFRAGDVLLRVQDTDVRGLSESDVARLVADTQQRRDPAGERTIRYVVKRKV